MLKFNTTFIGSDPEIAIHHLKNGAIIAIPTETVYGLAGNALDGNAVAQIFIIKNRPQFDPLIVHVSETGAVERYTLEFPDVARMLAGHFWPGPLTLLLPKRPIIPDLVTAGLPTVAIRMPAHPLALNLLRNLDFPLAAPSANPFGYVSPTTAQHVYDQLNGSIPYILDGGTCQVGVESTIVGFENGQPIVYRLGGLTIEEIESVAGRVELRLQHTSNPSAPGMLDSHYAPRKPLYLGDLKELSVQFKNKKNGILAFQASSDLPESDSQMVLSQAGNLEEAAQNLFAAIRTLDGADIEVILAEKVPDHGLGRAINDRLFRAAVKNH